MHRPLRMVNMPDANLEQPWQERLILFVVLCAMTAYLARIVYSFRRQGLAISRAESEDDISSSDDQPGGRAVDEHSD